MGYYCVQKCRKTFCDHNYIKISIVEKMSHKVFCHMTADEEHCVKLANFIIPELRVLLARQRRDYEISEDFPATYPVNDQAPNVDDTPINLAMRRLLGTTDYRLHKLKILHAVSRSMVFSKTADLRVIYDKSFKSFRQEAEKKAGVSLKWSERMKEKYSKGMDEKSYCASA